MRKVAFAAVVASLAAVGIAGPAYAVNADQTVAVKVTPSKSGTKAKPKGVKLKVTTTTTPKDATAFATKQAVISFDKNLVFNGAKFKSCTAAQLQASEASCPAGSKVGGGSAVGVLLSTIKANLTVTAFNGPGGKSVLLHVVGTTPAAIDSVIDAKLKKASGKYGYKLVVPIPAGLQQPVPGAFATLTSFITSVSGTAKGVPYIGLKGCSGGKLNFKGDFSYTDGTSKSATSTAKCT
jgi:hypothetical protein